MSATIFALATAPGRGAIAVVRVSGPLSGRVAELLGGAPLPLDRRARLRRLSDPESGDAIDEALLIGFSEGRSFTGEACVEFHLHGGPATSSALLAALAALEGLRPARPGEFARRALEHGKIDLTQAEAMADLVAAETDAQRRIAIDGLGGALSRRVAEWRASLTRALALLEAAIDFADEDLGAETVAPAAAIASGLRAALEAEIGRGAAARRVREGTVVAVLGPPNVGKSSIINAIAERDVAIVSEIPGTTRDVLEVRCDLQGYAVTFLDTAGLRDSEDPIERLGVARARQRAVDADLRIHVAAPGEPPPEGPVGDGDFCLVNKIDRWAKARCGVSAMTGEGIEWLLEVVAARAAALGGGAGAAFRDRHVAAMAAAVERLAAVEGAEPEIAAEEIRSAASALDSVVGALDVEDVLEEVFGSFCIGK
jgi:tRNA modification GTPase